MIVPFCDLTRESRALEAPLMEAAQRVIRSGRFLYGAELEAFEHELAAWHGVKYAVGVASGTDAVEIALRAGMGAPYRTGTTAMTAVPTINAIEAAGSQAMLFDPDPVTRNADRTWLRVHLYGLMTATDFTQVEDCAHAMGATKDGRVAGTNGHTGALSFYPTKLLGACGDGGALITNDKDIADRARSIRHYGTTEDGAVSMRGQNSRLSELQASFLRTKLPLVHGWINQRRALAARYNEELAGRVTLPTEPAGCRHVYHVFAVEHSERARIVAGLTERGIGVMRHYPLAIHQHERWKHLGEPGQFPVAEKLAATVFSLPLYPYLTGEEQTAVINAVKELT